MRDHQIASVVRLIAELHDSFSPLVSQDLSQNNEAAGEATTKNDPKIVTNTAYEVLKERDEPMHRTEIFDALAVRGVSVNGHDPLGNLSAHLSGDKIRFMKTTVDGKTGFWQLRQWADRKRFEEPRSSQRRVIDVQSLLAGDTA
ncbi:MAG: winged helix-turn-helix domain-containing protein [Chloroflexota bacterium]|nr:winged helix-turn-helix domain-containing protein [Chloroflexota bacterium]